MRFHTFINTVVNGDRRILNEGFGFDYSFPPIPSHGDNAIYDFYALSMIDPNDIKSSSFEGGDVKIYTQDEDLQWSIFNAIKVNMNGMRDYLLEAVERAIICEIYHFQPFWNVENRDKMSGDQYISQNPQFKKIFETIKKKINPDNVEYNKGNFPQYDERYEIIKSLGISQADLFIFAENIFSQTKGSCWHSSYGGAAWKEIAKGGTRLLNTEPIPKDQSIMHFGIDKGKRGELMVAIDHVVDLAHNTGAIFTKWLGSPYSLISSGKHPPAIENKKFINSLTEYANYVSGDLQKVMLHLGRLESPEQKKFRAPHPKHKHDVSPIPMSKEGIKTFSKNIAEKMGINSSEGIAAAEKLVNEQLKYWNKQQSQGMYLTGKSSRWISILNSFSKKLEKEFGIDSENEKNKVMLIPYLIEISDRLSVRQAKGTPTKQPAALKTSADTHTAARSTTGMGSYDEFITKLLKDNKWRYTNKEPASAMLNRYKAMGATGIADIDDDATVKWLTTNYKENPDEFAKFSEQFISGFEKMIDGRLSEKEKDHIQSLIDKASAIGYKKATKKEPALALDSVNHYLGKFLD